MLREILYGSTTIPILKRGIDAFADRQRAIAANIANSEVEGYRRREVVFEDLLIQALGEQPVGVSVTNPKHIPTKKDLSSLHHIIIEPDDKSNPSGVNNVNIEREMADLATNQIQFSLTARKMKGYFNKIRDIAKPGGI